jgi:hypothetical protein
MLAEQKKHRRHVIFSLANADRTNRAYEAKKN